MRYCKELYFVRRLYFNAAGIYVTKTFVINLLLTFWIAMFTAKVAADMGDSIVVVSHDSVPVAQLSLKELRAVFTMKQTVWPNGESIKVFVLENDNKLHKQFCMEVLGAFPRQLESVWYRLVYSGTGRAPFKVESEEALLESVSNTPGAIGYINAEQMNEDVELIKIIK